MEFQIIDTKKAQTLRQIFIDNFLNVKAEYYHERIEKSKQYSDGLCYDGYLWEVLKDNDNYEKRCSMEKALNYLRKKKEVYVMWDIYSNERVMDGSYLALNYPKGTIILMNGEVLSQLIAQEWTNGCMFEHMLPEDIYCFDEDFGWYTVFTHEGFDCFTNPELGEDEYRRICFLDDWRLIGQESYLKNIMLYHIDYKPISKESDHDHCELCRDKFYLDGKNLDNGYCTEPENKHDALWICSECYEDFREMFGWTEKNTL